MFGSIGIFELIIIAGIALMVLGPERFPEFAKMAARFVRDVRSYAGDVQREISKEIRPVQDELRDLQRIDPERYLESLMEEEDEEDQTINPEPHPSEVDWYPPEQEEGEEDPESSAVRYGSAEPDQYDTYPREEDGEEEEEFDRRRDPSSEWLDG